MINISTIITCGIHYPPEEVPLLKYTHKCNICRIVYVLSSARTKDKNTHTHWVSQNRLHCLCERRWVAYNSLFTRFPTLRMKTLEQRAEKHRAVFSSLLYVVLLLVLRSILCQVYFPVWSKVLSLQPLLPKIAKFSIYSCSRLSNLLSTVAPNGQACHLYKNK